MVTTPKGKKSATAGSRIVSSKKKGLSKKQWTTVAIVGALILTIGGYFGIQQYQNLTSNAAGWKSFGQIKLSSSSKSYALFSGYACKAPTSKAATYTVKVKLQINNVNSNYAATDSRAANIYANNLQFNFQSKNSSGKVTTYATTIWAVGLHNPTLQNFTSHVGSFSTTLRGTDVVQFKGWVNGGSIQTAIPNTVASLTNC